MGIFLEPFIIFIGGICVINVFCHSCEFNDRDTFADFQMHSYV